MTDSYVLEVVEVVDETADARSISFRVPEGAESAFEYKPGQFLTLAVPSDRDGLAARCAPPWSASGETQRSPTGHSICGR